jgi:predicted ATPase
MGLDCGQHGATGTTALVCLRLQEMANVGTHHERRPCTPSVELMQVAGGNHPAALQRVAVVIEDVHWADRSTLELLDYVLAPGHETGVPMLITSRSEETPSTGWLERAQRSPRIKRLDLPLLSRDETAEQIELLIGEHPTQ